MVLFPSFTLWNLRPGSYLEVWSTVAETSCPRPLIVLRRFYRSHSFRDIEQEISLTENRIPPSGLFPVTPQMFYDRIAGVGSFGRSLCLWEKQLNHWSSLRSKFAKINFHCSPENLQSLPVVRYRGFPVNSHSNDKNRMDPFIGFKRAKFAQQQTVIPNPAFHISLTNGLLRGIYNNTPLSFLP